MRQTSPIGNSYWVRRGRLLAGEYPGAWGEEEGHGKVVRLLEAGVTFILDLTEEGEAAPYLPLLHQEAAVRGRAVEHRHMPIPNTKTPTPEEMVQILNTIDTAQAAGHVVYLHCRGGIGRTGTVIGCFLVRHGLSGEEALQEIAYLRSGIRRGGQPSPFRETQRQMVLNWSAGR